MACGTASPPVKFEKLGEGPEKEVFDKVVLGDSEPFHVMHGEEHLRRLYEMFPENQRDIDRYLELSQNMVALFPLFCVYKSLPAWCQSWWWNTFLSGTWSEYAGKTAESVLGEITQNPKLASILSGLW